MRKKLDNALRLSIMIFNGLNMGRGIWNIIILIQAFNTSQKNILQNSMHCRLFQYVVTCLILHLSE